MGTNMGLVSKRAADVDRAARRAVHIDENQIGMLEPCDAQRDLGGICSQKGDAVRFEHRGQGADQRGLARREQYGRCAGGAVGASCVVRERIEGHVPPWGRFGMLLRSASSGPYNRGVPLSLAWELPSENVGRAPWTCG